MEIIEDDLTFLPFLIDEDIYLIESAQNQVTANLTLPKTEEKSAVPSIPALPKMEPIILRPSQNEVPKTAEIVTPKPEPIIAKTVDAPRPPVAANQIINKKVIIMVGYQSFPTVPPNVQEALQKIFGALSIDLSTVEIINVLASNPPKIENYTFEYLILMGGNGKNLAFMQNFTGTRNRYDIAKHGGKTIFFAESMDVYFKDQELKKKFWTKLKEVFAK